MADLEGQVADEPPATYRRAWTAERIGWAVAALVLGAGAMGAFGDGPLARARAASPDGTLVVDYGRFARRNAPAVVRASVRAGGAVRLGLDRALADGLEVEGVVPEPERVTAAGDWYEYTFATAGDGSATIVFRTRARHAGNLRGRMRLGDGPPVALAQLVYP